MHSPVFADLIPSFECVLQEIRHLHNEQLMGIRREEEMEMSDDDMEDMLDSKDSEDSGTDLLEWGIRALMRMSHRELYKPLWCLCEWRRASHEGSLNGKTPKFTAWGSKSPHVHIWLSAAKNQYLYLPLHLS